MKNIAIILILTVGISTPIISHGAVTSVGEINVQGETKGVVPASSTVPLIVTLVVDRSLAEPGEEIKTIEIIMPPGFLTQSSLFKGIKRDGNSIVARAVVAGGTVLRVELADAVVDFQNSIYENYIRQPNPKHSYIRVSFQNTAPQSPRRGLSVNLSDLDKQMANSTTTILP